MGTLLFLLVIAQAAPKSDVPSQAYFMHRFAMRGETQVVEMLLKMGADVNSPDQQGKTPLHDACLTGRVETAKLLLDHGAKIGARDKLGATPLHDAALGGNVAVIRLLLSRNAAADVRDSGGLRPIDYATKMDRTDAAKVLSEVGLAK